jgi:hypothetical protein
MRLLIVDDDPVMLRTLVRSFKRWGWEVSAYRSPPPTNAPLDYDVALIDWRPWGPRMTVACTVAKLPHIIFTGDLDGVPCVGCCCCVIAKGTPLTDVDAALRLHAVKDRIEAL